MTTGSYNHSAPQTIATSCSGTDQIGLYQDVKSWNGADQTPEPKRYVWLKNARGKFYRKRVRERRRRYDPHAYSTTIERSYFPLVYERRTAATACNVWSTVTTGRGCFISTMPPGFVDPWTNNNYLELLSKIHAKLYGSTFDPGVFLAEGHKSLEMIGNAATRLAKGLKHLKRGNIRASWLALTGQRSRPITVRGITYPAFRDPLMPPVNPQKGLANVWAEFRWGWTPLVNDMYDGAVFVAHQLHAPCEFRIAARRRVNKNVGSYTGATSGAVWATSEWEHSKQIVAYLREPPNNSVLNVLNPASIAWELVPYSFVVDWAIPIGDYLRARSVPGMMSGTFVTSDKSWQKKKGQKYNVGLSYCKNGFIYTTGDHASYDKIVFNRSISTSLDVPLPEWKGFEKVATMKHAVDSIALLTQVFKK